MPSRLRQSISPDDSSFTPSIASQQPPYTLTSRSKSTSTHAAVRQRQNKKMSLTQTYRVAATARSKLGSEAGRPNHRLRHLVGHANLLDSLMVELADAEQDQEQWFNETVKSATATPATTASIPPTSESMQHVRWTDTEVEDPDENAIDEDDDDDTSSDSSTDYDEDAEEISAQIPLIRIRSPPVQITTMELSSSHGKHDADFDVYDEDEDIYFEDEEYDEAHALVRINSHSNPPELVHDDDEASASSSDDEEEAVSPPPLSTQQQELLSKDLGLTYHSNKMEKRKMRLDLSHSGSTVEEV